MYGAGGGGMLLSGYAGWIDAAVLAGDEPPRHRAYALAGLYAAGIGGAALWFTLRKKNNSAASPSLNRLNLRGVAERNWRA